MITGFTRHPSTTTTDVADRIFGRSLPLYTIFVKILISHIFYHYVQYLTFSFVSPGIINLEVNHLGKLSIRRDRLFVVVYYLLLLPTP